MGGDKKSITLKMGLYNRHIVCELYVPVIVNCTYMRCPL